jgi:hypothetical protein
MSNDKVIFFEARRHTGSEGFVLYVGGENPNVPRKREDFRTKEELLAYLGKFNLQRFTPEQVLQQLMLPPQKDTNPPGTKFIFTARETPAEKRDCVVMLSRADIEVLERALRLLQGSTSRELYPGARGVSEEVKQAYAKEQAEQDRIQRLLDELHRVWEQAA